MQDLFPASLKIGEWSILLSKIHDRRSHLYSIKPNKKVKHLILNFEYDILKNDFYGRN